jgi:flagellar basal-body rod protein FlgF
MFTGTAAGVATGTVHTGALEGSGVDEARTTVQMLSSMRAIEASQKAITTIDDTLKAAAGQIGNLPA